MTEPTSIKQRLEFISNSIATTCRKHGRPIDTVKLVAVSKRFPITSILEAMASGQEHFGENYITELADKSAGLTNQQVSPNWHYIGPMQRRQVPQIPNTTMLIHSLDRIAILDRFQRTWATPWPPFLVQVNIGKEPQKAGVFPEKLHTFLETAKIEHPKTVILGLMAIPPKTDDATKTQNCFSQIRQLAEQATTEGFLPKNPELSMGMSADYPLAIAEGATIIRIGSAIFGSRPNETSNRPIASNPA